MRPTWAHFYFMVNIMIKLYFFIGTILTVYAAYLVGIHTGTHQCQTEAANVHASQINDTIKTMGIINAKTVNTGVDDIRRILREKYTIAE